jgi:hypothetical protein
MLRNQDPPIDLFNEVAGFVGEAGVRSPSDVDAVATLTPNQRMTADELARRLVVARAIGKIVPDMAVGHRNIILRLSRCFRPSSETSAFQTRYLSAIASGAQVSEYITPNGASQATNSEPDRSLLGHELISMTQIPATEKPADISKCYPVLFEGLNIIWDGGSHNYRITGGSNSRLLQLNARLYRRDRSMKRYADLIKVYDTEISGDALSVVSNSAKNGSLILKKNKLPFLQYGIDSEPPDVDPYAIFIGGKLQ